MIPYTFHSPDMAIHTPLLVVKSFSEVNCITLRGEILPDSSMQIILENTKDLNTLTRRYVAKMSRKDARIALKDMKSTLPEIMKQEHQFMKDFQGKASPEKVKIVKDWFEAVYKMFTQIIIRGESKSTLSIISDNLIGSHLESVLAENNVVLKGEKALMSLFD